MMQFSYNSDHPDIDPYTGAVLPRTYDNGNGSNALGSNIGSGGAVGVKPTTTSSRVRSPAEFPNVAPIPCARITTRVYHPKRNETMTVQNVLVRTVMSLSSSTSQSVTNDQHNRRRSSAASGESRASGGAGGAGGGGRERGVSSMDYDEDDDDDDDDDSFMSSSEEGSESGINDNTMQQQQGFGGGKAGEQRDTAVFRDEYAYWTQRTIRDAIYGRVLFATVLRRRRPNESIPTTQVATSQQQQQQGSTLRQSTTTPDWIVTDQYCAVKEMSWLHIRKDRDRLAEDPIKEVAAMQYIKTYFDSQLRYQRQQRQLQIQQQQQQIIQQQQEQQHQHLLILQAQERMILQQHQMQFEPVGLKSQMTVLQPQAIATTPNAVSISSTTMSLTAVTDRSISNVTASSTTTLEQQNSTDGEHDYNSPESTFRAILQTNVMMPLDLLSDDRYLYSIMPFCDGGELFERLDMNEQFTEDEARYWMKQILNGIENLQNSGICHRDISLENILVHKETGALIIDMGMCLLLPFEEPTPTNQMMQQEQQQAVSQVSSSSNYNTMTASMESLNLLQRQNGTFSHRAVSLTPSTSGIEVRAPVSRRLCQRFLVSPQGTCGKWIYMSPEILKNKEPFDGFAVDMWAAGVILFLMLTGFPPWERACLTDERFKYMSGGYLVQMLTEWEVGISGDALDLLQRMLFYDPKDRLSLDQVRAHPWMVRGSNSSFPISAIPPGGGGR